MGLQLEKYAVLGEEQGVRTGFWGRILPRRLHLQVSFIVSLLLIATIASYAGWTARQQTARYLSGVTSQASLMARNFASVSANYLLVEDGASLELFLIKLAELPNIVNGTAGKDAKRSGN